jgi:predicted small lipoprotein YifL
MKKFSLVFMISFLCGTLLSCGQTGNLYLPDDEDETTKEVTAT